MEAPWDLQVVGADNKGQIKEGDKSDLACSFGQDQLMTALSGLARQDGDRQPFAWRQGEREL